MPETANLRSLVRQATTRFTTAQVPTPAVDARLLARHALEKTDGGTYELVDDVSPAFMELFESYVSRREEREPLQLITGETFFAGVRLEMAEGVFIPRLETELLAEDAARAAASFTHPRVIDLCTGSGAIAIAVARMLDDAGVSLPDIYAVEINPTAAQLAETNAQANNVSIHVVNEDVATAVSNLAGLVDVVVSNPPYIPAHAVPRDLEVRRWDPPRALYGGGEDGLTVPGVVVRRAKELLKPGGLFLMEHADCQGLSVRELVESAGGFTMIHTRRDLAGRERYVSAVRAEESL